MAEEQWTAQEQQDQQVVLRFIDQGWFDIRDHLKEAYDAASPSRRLEIEDFAERMAKKGWRQFRFGTTFGVFRHTERWFEMGMVENLVPGNLHFGYLLDHVETTASKHGQYIRIHDVRNKRVRDWLIDNAGYRMEDRHTLVKQQFEKKHGSTDDGAGTAQ